VLKKQKTNVRSENEEDNKAVDADSEKANNFEVGSLKGTHSEGKVKVVEETTALLNFNSMVKAGNGPTAEKSLSKNLSMTRVKQLSP